MRTGPWNQAIETSAGATEMAVDTTATIYTKAIDLRNCAEFALSYKAYSLAGAVDMKIEIEQSWKAPAGEGVTALDWVVPEGFSDVETNLTTEVWHHKSITPLPLRYLRFKITGQGSNDADAVIYMRVSMQAEV